MTLSSVHASHFNNNDIDSTYSTCHIARLHGVTDPTSVTSRDDHVGHVIIPVHVGTPAVFFYDMGMHAHKVCVLTLLRETGFQSRGLDLDLQWRSALGKVTYGR